MRITFLFSISICLVLISVSLASALPTPSIVYESKWDVTHDTDYHLDTYFLNAKDKKTEICLVLKEGLNPSNYSLTARQLYNRTGLILDDKNKPLTIKWESSKCNIRGQMKDGYHLSLTLAQAINIDDYIRIGDSTTVVEYLNDTLYVYNTTFYDKDGFEVEVFDDNESSNHIGTTWVERRNMFYPNGSIPYPLSEVHFKVNKFEETSTTKTPYTTTTLTKQINFDDFRAKNNITEEKTTALYPSVLWCIVNNNYIFIWEIKNCLETPNAYLKSFRGNITDLDPSIDLKYDSADDLIFANRTEGISLGARLESPALYMNFNKVNETTYVQDNSIKNHFGTASGNPLWHLTRGFDGSGTYIFDGADDWIGSTTGDLEFTNEGTISAWFWSNSSQVTMSIFDLQANAKIPGAFNMQTERGELRGYLYAGGCAFPSNRVVVASGVIVNDSAWHHGALVYNGTGLRIYVDGAFKASVNNTGTICDDAVGWGLGTSRVATPANFFNGSIDNVMILDKALSDSEVLNLYNKNETYQGKYANEGNFSSLVYFNDTSGAWNVSLNISDSDGEGLVDKINSSGLVSYWALNENGADSFGSNGGILNGTNNATGISSGALRFDRGSSDWINSTDPTDIGFNDDFSVSVWVNFDSVDNIFDGLVTKQSSGDTQGWGIVKPDNGAAGNKIAFITWQNPGFTYTIANDVPVAGTWYYVTAVRNSGTNSLYINGIKQTDTDTVSLQASTKSLVMGRFYGDVNNFYLNGVLDEATIYNRSLSNGEILFNFRAGLSIHAKTNISLETRTATSYNLSDANLTHFWSFNDDSLTLAIDEMNNYNGSRNGGIANASEINGTVGKGYSFDGSDDEINAGDNAFTEFTASVWIRTTTVTSQFYTIFTDLQLVGGFKENIGLYFNGPASGSDVGTVIFQLTEGGAFKSITTTGTYDDDVWHSLIFTYNGSDSVGYIDGVEIGRISSLAGTIDTTSNQNFTIGRRSDGLFYKGAMDEVKIYNRSMPSGEVRNLYELGTHHIEWGSWTNEGRVTDTIPTTTTNEGKFMQFKSIHLTNDTDVSPYVLNHSVRPGNSEVVDDNPPTFVTIPDNASIEFGTQWDGVLFNASDDVATANWTVNSTDFSINHSGFLSNTVLLGVGVYQLNITINDTSSNINWTSYQFTVVQNTSACDVTFNETSGLFTTNQFLPFTNCELGGYKLTRNNTQIANNSAQLLVNGRWNFTVVRNDTVNYSNTLDFEWFIVEQPVNTPTRTKVTVGTEDAGDETSTQYLNDSLWHNVSEVSGSPGWTIEYNFTNFTATDNLTINVWYEGNPAHEVEVLIFNESDRYRQIYTIPEGSEQEQFTFPINTTIDADVNGLVRVALNHSTSGVNSHDVFVDYLALQLWTPPSVPSNVTAVATPTCRWSRYGYYNLNLPWFRQTGCVT